VKTERAARVLLAVGLLQMAGDALGILPLKAVGAATAASPAPRVFTAWRGLEAFSTRFALEWLDRRAGWRALELDPETAARLRGPYNRRNVYGAVLAAGPVLASDPLLKPMFEAVVAHALCGEAPLLRELGADPDPAAAPRVRYVPRAGTARDLPLRIVAPCASAS
jgi:hypothetical protein